MEKGGWVYLMTNKYNTVIYVGVTSDLRQRVFDHQNSRYPGSFTSRYRINKLVYFHFFDSIQEAIDEEKRIKGGNRQSKLNMINQMNPEWKDLSNGVEI
ncbi:GIY-YIG nuclease family protein [Pedobacter sp. GR22-6]|uniref:GIY-YIG nuclease family protein n=1 Tax=Pedobacter sp. GR22-6 TaxID=3127957 RepID=UPI00307D2450